MFSETTKIGELNDDTEYTFWITAENAAGKSEDSDPTTVKTQRIGMNKHISIFIIFHCMLYFLYFKYALNLSSLKFVFSAAILWFRSGRKTSLNYLKQKFKIMECRDESKIAKETYTKS